MGIAFLPGCTPLQPEPGSRAACSAFQEQVSGVWYDAEGREKALLVLASNSNGWGCFALLNAVPEWGLDAPVASNANVKRQGAYRTMVRNETSVLVNLATCEARFSSGERTFQGKVLDISGRRPDC